jgi:hypothetical protein
VAHSFLMEAGRWNIEGSWLERDREPILVKGKTIVAWNQENWFVIVTKLVFPNSERDEISYQCRGHLDSGECRYTYVVNQSLLGRVEGEGWIGPDSIVQRYWVLGDRQRRSGFETFYRLNDNIYNLSGGLLAGHYLTSTMEAVLKRQTQSS